MDDSLSRAADDAALARAVAALSPVERRVLRAGFAAGEWAPLLRDWAFTARPEQLPPPGDWRVWLIMAGRGFGKTRAGAEWVNALARAHPDARIALVGASHDDVRQVMVEGESGILASAAPRHRPVWHPALRRLVWPGGAIAAGYSAAEPEGLRGPQFHFAWADEVARWEAHGLPAGAEARSRGAAAWDNLAMALRLGAHPRVLATTTPRALPIVRRLLALPDVTVTRGSTLDNAAHLAPGFIAAMHAAYGDTLLARQEIGGELIEDVPGALWTRGGIEGARIAEEALPPAALARVVIGVDPPAGRDGDACGIIVCGALAVPLIVAGREAAFAVLADASVERAGPEQWARAVADAARHWRADRIVAEANNGGEMVRSVLLAEDAALPVSLVHASRGKAARAEPVAHAHARGRLLHRGAFPALEDQLCGLLAGGAYCGPGRSPDRADAYVWAMSELLNTRAQPGVRRL
jgi:phage terminase large subunit-like protein